MRTPMPLAALLVAAVACSDEPSGSNTPQAELTVVHATATLGAVDITVGNATVIDNLAFGAASRRVAVPAGTQHIVIRAGTQIISEIDATLSATRVNALVIADSSAHVADDVVPDTGAVAPTRANLRLVNVVGANATAPTMLDVLINFPGVSQDSTARLGGWDARVARYHSLLYFDPGDFVLRFVPAGGSSVLAQAAFSIAAGEVKVAVLERADDGTYRITLATEAQN